MVPSQVPPQTPAPSPAGSGGGGPSQQHQLGGLLAGASPRAAAMTSPGAGPKMMGPGSMLSTPLLVGASPRTCPIGTPPPQMALATSGVSGGGPPELNLTPPAHLAPAAGGEARYTHQPRPQPDAADTYKPLAAGLTASSPQLPPQAAHHVGAAAAAIDVSATMSPASRAQQVPPQLEHAAAAAQFSPLGDPSLPPAASSQVLQVAHVTSQIFLASQVFLTTAPALPRRRCYSRRGLAAASVPRRSMGSTSGRTS